MTDSRPYVRSNARHQHDDWQETHSQLQRVQKKTMGISDPDDADEKEADTIARAVSHGPSLSAGNAGNGNNSAPFIQRKIQIKKSGTEDYEDFIPDSNWRTSFTDELTTGGYNPLKGMEILDGMLLTNEVMKYDSQDLLKKEIKFRVRRLNVMENQIKSITGFGDFSTKATLYWDVKNAVSGSVNVGFRLKKVGEDEAKNTTDDPDTGNETENQEENQQDSPQNQQDAEEVTPKNMDPVLAMKALVDPANDLSVDCATAVMVSEYYTEMLELGEEAFRKKYETLDLLIQPYTTQIKRNTKRSRTVDVLTKADQSSTDRTTLVASAMDQLIPGDHVVFLNYVGMSVYADPFSAEHTVYMGKNISGDRMFRGHPFDQELTYAQVIAKLEKAYKDFYKNHKGEHGMNKPGEPEASQDTIEGTLPGISVNIERPDIMKLSEVSN